MSRSNEEESLKHEENEYIEIAEKQQKTVSFETDDRSDFDDDRHDAETISVTSLDNYTSEAASIFFGGNEPEAVNRKRKPLRNYEDNVSQTEYDC